jgi:hypothetical protein
MGKLMNRPSRKATGAVRGTTVPRRMASTLLSVALLTGAAAFSAGAANAAVTRSTSPDVSTVSLVFADGTHHSYDCTIGQDWSVKARVKSVDNGCSTEVLLEFSNGPDQCLSPHQPELLPSEPTVESLLITASIVSC